MSLHFYHYGVPNEDGGYSLSGLPAFSVFAFWFLITIGMEQILGSTIGSYLFRIKPVSTIENNDELEKVSFSQSIKRHLLAPVDAFFFGLVGIILISSTEKGQRLGDLWARTKIIKRSK